MECGAVDEDGMKFMEAVDSLSINGKQSSFNILQNIETRGRGIYTSSTASVVYLVAIKLCLVETYIKAVTSRGGKVPLTISMQLAKS